MECLLQGGKQPQPESSAVPDPAALFRSGSSANAESLMPPAAGGTDLSADEVAKPRTANRIALAKAVLSEACAYARATRLPRAGSTSPLKLDIHAPAVAASAGPLGSVLALLQAVDSDAKACSCLNTLSFLILDRANRKAVAELDGVGIMLGALHRFSDPAVYLAALEALVTLVRHDECEKVRLWESDLEGRLVALLDPRHPVPHLLQTLSLFKRAAFTTHQATAVRLLEPRLVPALASLLHPTADAEVLSAALKFLQVAAQCSDVAHLSAWYPAIFRIVPLLQQQAPGTFAAACGDRGPAQGVPGCPHCTLDGVLQPLLSLSDHEAFRNALYAAGCLPLLLPLLSHAVDRIKLAATCILANLVESSLCRQQMCGERAVMSMLNALRVASSTEATVGMLYILGRLATSCPQVVSVLRQHGTLPLTVMMQCNPGDHDVLLGLQQLLELMQSPPTSTQGSDSDVSRTSSDLRSSGELAGNFVLRTSDSDVHLVTVAEERVKQCMPRKLTHTASSSGIVNLCAMSWL